ncbi:MAG: DUF4012 domain-containing protein, partial [Actinobacteria bacterium]|nr:DUF4012 domain-containing protein [Actinomycetota bacterium]
VSLRLSSPPLRVVGLLPVMRQQLATARALASSSALVTRAGQQITAGAADLPGGVAALAPADGAFAVAPLRSLAPRLARAADLVGQAHRQVTAADGRLLVGPLREGRAQLLAELEPAARSLDTAARLSDALPAFLGADGTRRYLFGAATPAELRGTGGLVGAYAQMTTHDGTVTFGEFVPASSLPRAVDDPPPPPSADYQRRYGEFAAAGHWSNINMTPDFPTAAVAMERLYARTVGDRVDGTVVADPFALQLLLEATGPVDVPAVGTVRADTVVDYLTHDSYVELPDPARRKQVLGRVAAEVFAQFLRSDVAPERKGRLLAEAAGGGHVLLHATDDEVQDAFVRAEVAGQMLPADDDYVAVIANNAAANKIDHFAERELDYRVDLRPDGTAHGRLVTRIRNTAPADGEPRYVIGPSDDRFDAGENVMLLSTFCSAWCRIDGFRVDGEPAAIGQQTELDRQVLPSTVRVPAGRTRELTYDWELMRGWHPDGDAGTYRLTVQGQPTARPTALSLRIAVPQGTRVTRLSDGLRVDGGEVVWDGELGRVLRVEVVFARERNTWQRVRAALNRPLW